MPELKGFRITEGRDGLLSVTLQSESPGVIDVFKYNTDREFLGQIYQAIGEYVGQGRNVIEEIQRPDTAIAALEPGIPQTKRRYRPIGDAGRIAIVFFPIVEPGGINTYIHNLQRAWRTLGHTVDMYYATPNGRMRRLSETRQILVGKFIRLAGKQIAYGDEEKVEVAKKTLNRYDLVVFAHQCPHPDIRGNGGREWMELYDLRRPIFSVFHDNIWNRAYPWLEEVAGQIDVALCTNPRIALDSGRTFPGTFVYTPHPMDVSNAGLWRTSKSNTIIWLPQWKTWKGIKHFGEACQYLDFQTDLYNTGIDYYQLRKKAPWWKKSFGKDEWDPTVKVRGNPHVTIHGPVLMPRIPKLLQAANVSVDLLGIVGNHSQGQYSYVQVESMLYGAVPFVFETTVQEPSPIPADCVQATSSTDPVEIAREINNLMMDRPAQLAIAKNAVDFARGKFDELRIGQGILDLLNNPEKLKRPKKWRYSRLRY